MFQFTIQLALYCSSFCRCIWYYIMFIWILDAWVTFSISVFVISSVSWIIARTDILLYLGDVSYICCVFAIVLDARGRFSFTRFDETGNVVILLHRCVCRVFYIYMHVCVLRWCRILQVQVPGRYGVSSPPGFTGLSVPYMSDGSGGDSFWP